MKKFYYYLFTILLYISVVTVLTAQKPGQEDGNSYDDEPSINLRSGCAPSISLTTQSVNNVRLTLLAGGDLWRNNFNGGYFVPNPPPGNTDPLRSVIFAGALWLGGFDEGGNLKLAAQTYRGQGNVYWPGPIMETTGETNPEICQNWDKHFIVHGTVIQNHISLIETYIEAGSGQIPDNEIHPELLRWPAQGNPHFTAHYGFELPDQILAPFFDYDGDGLYNPANGDFPVPLNLSCSFELINAGSIPAQMAFWIINDVGNLHPQILGMPIGVEVHAMSYAFSTDDELNDMSFQAYRIINRSSNLLDSFVIGKWVDFDLGCPDDDLFGFDIERSLTYVYNYGDTDGPPGVDCFGANTYFDKVPLAGFKKLSSPENEFGDKVGIQSFMYYMRTTLSPITYIFDPNSPHAYYYYMTSRWRNGLPLTYGGYGYGGTTETNYVFPSPPSEVGGWSMCQLGVPFTDIRTVTSTGKFTSSPGQMHTISYANVWVPNEQSYPCPDLTRLTYAADKAQYLFDNCFNDFMPLGPDAPDLDIIELDRELIIVLSNDDENSNNSNEAYDFTIPVLPDLHDITDSSYTFEGYKVYQLQNPNVKPVDYDNPDKARLIFQSDIRNEIAEISNFIPLPGYAGIEGPVYENRKMVSGVNQGLRKSFNISYDYFSGAPLVNHKRYFYSVVAYAHNNYKSFDEDRRIGQRQPYLQGKGNVRVYTGIPRTLDAEFPGMEMQSHYGETPAMIRLDGIGNGGQFVSIESHSRDRIVNEGYVDSLHYQRGYAPVNVYVFDPIRLKSGNYRLRLFDEHMEGPVESSAVKWELSNLDNLTEKWISSHTLDAQNEQFIPELGLAIRMLDVNEPGQTHLFQNGFIPAMVQYESGGGAWYSAVPDMHGTEKFFEHTSAKFDELFRLQRTIQLEPDYNRDRMRNWTQVAGGMWHPYALLNSRETAAAVPYKSYISPAWINQLHGPNIQANNPLSRLSNVDIVITPDKSKWSRCVVVETSNVFHTTRDSLPTIGNANQFDLRQSPSVGKYDMAGDGKADPDESGIGMGWFPGYAIDIMTGRRLNIFFGENSFYSAEIASNLGLTTLPSNGGDMMWNPSDDYKIDLSAYGLGGSLAEIAMGAQHMIYVSRTDYDEGAAMYEMLNRSGQDLDLAKRELLRTISWASFPVMEQGFSLSSLGSGEFGLIPTEVVFQLRANSLYATYEATGSNAGYPDYIFSTADMKSGQDATVSNASILDQIRVVPNPYYAYSMYEANANDRRVRIINLPGKSDISIFSLDGRFLKKIEKDDQAIAAANKPGILPQQLLTSADWDLRDASGTLVSSGVYLIHIEVPGVGERVIKWFGVMREH